VARRRLSPQDMAVKIIIVDKLKDLLRGKSIRYQLQVPDRLGMKTPITKQGRVSMAGPNRDVPPLVCTGDKDEYGRERWCNLTVFFEDILGWDLLDPSDERKVMDMVRKNDLLVSKELTGFDEMVGGEAA